MLTCLVWVVLLASNTSCLLAQGLPLQCSVFVTRRAGLLKSTNSSNADYLFQPDKLHADMVCRLVPPPHACTLLP